MNSSSMQSTEENLGSHYALQVALQTMKERCQQLQGRLAAVEEENVCLRLECAKDTSMATVRVCGDDEKTMVRVLQEKVEQLARQKSQLTHHIFMVAAENRQLWNRLSRLTRKNESLGNHLTKISDTLKQHPPMAPADVMSYSFKEISKVSKTVDKNQLALDTNVVNKEQSLEEISLKLINSIMLEKSELEQQYAEMVEMQNSSEINLQNIGFSYPEDLDTDSIEQLKQHDSRLSHTKDVLLAQQSKLKAAIENMKNLKKGVTCKSCRKNARKKMCQTGTQFNSDDSFKENGATQTSLIPSATLIPENNHHPIDEVQECHEKICPLCGVLYGQSTTFAEYHEHVLTHFTEEEQSINDFELIH